MARSFISQFLQGKIDPDLWLTGDSAESVQYIPPEVARANTAEWMTRYLAEQGPTPIEQMFLDFHKLGGDPGDLAKAAADMGCIVTLPDEVLDLIRPQIEEEAAERAELDQQKRKVQEDFDKLMANQAERKPTLPAGSLLVDGDGDLVVMSPTSIEDEFAALLPREWRERCPSCRVVSVPVETDGTCAECSYEAAHTYDIED